MQRALKRQFRSDIEQVKAILRRWDPIGVFPYWPDSPTEDEYDSYAPHILSLLYGLSDVVALADHLEKLRTVEMGLPRLRKRDEETARELAELHLTSRS